MDLVTLGMLIIDDIHYPPPKPPSLSILGGAGSYAVQGARLFRPSPSSRNVGWVVHKGSDFPPEVEDEINLWNTVCEYKDTPWRKTTRGWNEYRRNENRAFKYLNEKLRVDHTQLTKSMLRSKAFHMICTSQRCTNLAQGILEERNQFFNTDGETLPRPIFVWEPVPDACGPEEYARLVEALQHVDVISPNHHELAALFSDKPQYSKIEDEEERMRQQCKEIHNEFKNRKKAVVVRCGQRGCYVRAGRKEFNVPAYHQPLPDGKSMSKVVDPTGAGNAFLGAFAVGMLDSLTAAEMSWSGALYGTIAASFAVEQVGLPTLQVIDGQEFWNGETVRDRLNKLKSRLEGSPE